MAANTYKNNASGNSGKSSFFAMIENHLNVERFFEDGLPIQYLPPTLFLTFLGILYIGNLHYAEKNIRKISSLEVEVEDLRADYTTLKADYMYTSKQSEVALKAAGIGLVESDIPPSKIVIGKDEY
ncbi:MAG: FtsL-like putative cell division protein [Cyclobacteriaceae bacterium]